MAAICPGPSSAPSLRKMPTRNLIGTIGFFLLCGLPFLLLAARNIWRNPANLSSYVLLIPAFFLLGPAHLDYLRELLRRRRENQARY